MCCMYFVVFFQVQIALPQVCPAAKCAPRFVKRPVPINDRPRWANFTKVRTSSSCPDLQTGDTNKRAVKTPTSKSTMVMSPPLNKCVVKITPNHSPSCLGTFIKILVYNKKLVFILLVKINMN